MDNDMMVQDIFVDDEQVGQFDPLRKSLSHRGHEFSVSVSTHYQAFDIFHSFYGLNGESQREFAKRFAFVPHFPPGLGEE